jgi:hypothetical protein
MYMERERKSAAAAAYFHLNERHHLLLFSQSGFKEKKVKNWISSRSENGKADQMVSGKDSEEA